MKLAINIPHEILKSAAWIHIKYLLIRTLSVTIINLIHQENTLYSGMLIRLMTKIKRRNQNQNEHTRESKMGHVIQTRKPRHRKHKRPEKQRTNLKWFLQHKAKLDRNEQQRDDAKNYGPKMRDKDHNPILKKGGSTIKICQYDGNADPEPESDDEEQGPLENIRASKC